MHLFKTFQVTLRHVTYTTERIKAPTLGHALWFACRDWPDYPLRYEANDGGQGESAIHTVHEVPEEEKAR